MHRILIAASVLVIALIALTACKKDKEASTDSPPGEPATSAATTATETPAAPETGTETETETEKPTMPTMPPSTATTSLETAILTAQPFDATSIYDIPLETLDGKPSKVGDYKGKSLLLVNVASKCGLTPQYATLESMQKKYGPRGFTVLGFPCNQFGGQEPGTSEEIAEFCSATYGVTFPMFEKIAVNGEERHPIYDKLTEVKDSSDEAGDIKWNFEKFVVSADGKMIHRFRPKTVPDAPEVIAAIEAGLPAAN